MFYLCSLKKKMHAGDNCVFCVLLCSLSVCVCVRHVDIQVVSGILFVPD